MIWLAYITKWWQTVVNIHHLIKTQDERNRKKFSPCDESSYNFLFQQLSYIMYSSVNSIDHLYITSLVLFYNWEFIPFDYLPLIPPPCPHYTDSLPAVSPGKPKNIGVDSHCLLQRIFQTKELNWGLLHYTWILYQLSYQGSPCCCCCCCCC